MRDTYGGVRFLHVLTTRARSAVDVDSKVGGIDFHLLHFIQFRQHGHGAGRGVDATLGFGRGNALHAVAARFELQLRIGAFTDYTADDFLVTAEVAFVFAHDFHLPAAAFGVAHVHAEQVARKKCRFVAARAGADFKEDVALIIGILRQKQDFKVFFQLLERRFPRLDFILGKVGKRRIFLGHFFGGGDVVFRFFVGLHLDRHRFDFRAFLREGAEAVHVVGGIGRREHGIDFFKAPAKPEKLAAHAVFHHGRTE